MRKKLHHYKSILLSESGTSFMAHLGTDINNSRVGGKQALSWDQVGESLTALKMSAKKGLDIARGVDTQGKKRIKIE